MAQRFDFVVVGGGLTGVACACALGRQGASVALIEQRGQGALGGAHVHETGIPRDVLAEAARIMDTVGAAAEAAIQFPEPPEMEFGGVVRRRVRATAAAAGQLAAQVQAAGVQVFHGRGCLSAADSVVVLDPATGNDTATLACGGVVLAVGATEEPPEEQGVLRLADLYALKRIPKTLRLSGSTLAALEAGSIFAALGAHVRVVRGGDPTPGVDSETLDKLAALMPGRVEVSGEEAPAEVLAHAGVAVPGTGQLGLLKLGVEVSESGHIVVRDGFCTAAPTIFAAGECAGQTGGAEQAWFLGEQAAAAARGVRVRAGDGWPVTHATSPRLALVGQAHWECAAEGREVVAGDYHAEAPDPQGLAWLRLVADSATGEILGAQGIGANAAAVVGVIAMLREAEYGAFEMAAHTVAEPAVGRPIIVASGKIVDTLRGGSHA